MLLKPLVLLVKMLTTLLKTFSIYEEELKYNDFTTEQRKELYKLIIEQVANSQQQNDKDKAFLGMAYGVIVFFNKTLAKSRGLIYLVIAKLWINAK
ncbi:hypothetical protein [Bacillus sp. UNCCL81]|uniref:hypothetical protein n=1 Tax=Bacillus sp. UNCCL81 TaxID=1502755 RepID=UPI0008DEB2F4|nr:hypothetical protein [Bacillus sp. UNCCL81]SFC31426.1 hypothetical protein SAMN02799633_00409 [Bacillus sp. UNCCL81]